MSWDIIGAYATAFCLIFGSIFTLVAGIGLLKLNDSMTRLHAPTKAGTVGIGAFLLGSVLHSMTFGDGSMHELLILAFLFVTAPISANFIAKVNIHRRSCDPLPSAPDNDTWATLDVPEADRDFVPSKDV